MINPKEPHRFVEIRTRYWHQSVLLDERRDNMPIRLVLIIVLAEMCLANPFHTSDPSEACCMKLWQSCGYSHVLISAFADDLQKI